MPYPLLPLSNIGLGFKSKVLFNNIKLNIQADDKIGFAFTKPLAAVSLVGGGDTGEGNGPYLWELYYSFKQNDSMTITPAVFAGKDVWQEQDNIFGVVVTTALKF